MDTNKSDGFSGGPRLVREITLATAFSAILECTLHKDREVSNVDLNRSRSANSETIVFTDDPR